MRYRKKPVVVEAMHWDGTTASIARICAWANDGAEKPNVSYLTAANVEGPFDVLCETLEGPLKASPGDWIIKGVKGEFYPCKPDIFEATYEPAVALEPSRPVVDGSFYPPA
jgi:hypothetical protein